MVDLLNPSSLVEKDEILFLNQLTVSVYTLFHLFFMCVCVCVNLFLEIKPSEIISERNAHQILLNIR